jgi:hypothetical protein
MNGTALMIRPENEVLGRFFSHEYSNTADPQTQILVQWGPPLANHIDKTTDTSESTASNPSLSASQVLKFNAVDFDCMMESLADPPRPNAALIGLNLRNGEY